MAKITSVMCPRLPFGKHYSDANMKAGRGNEALEGVPGTRGVGSWARLGRHIH